MNFKTINTILTLLSLNLLALSSPVINNEYSTDVVDIYINEANNNTQNITKDEYLMDKITDIDINSDEETDVIDNFGEEVSEIIELDENVTESINEGIKYFEKNTEIENNNERITATDNIEKITEIENIDEKVTETGNVDEFVTEIENNEKVTEIENDEKVTEIENVNDFVTEVENDNVTVTETENIDEKVTEFINNEEILTEIDIGNINEIVTGIEIIDEKETDIDNFDEEITEIGNVGEDENICNTKECIEVSNNLLNSIDTSVDPCDDFYQFACGNYIKNHPVDKNKARVKNFQSAANANKKNLIEIIEGDYHPNKNLSKEAQEQDEAVFNKLKGFYKSCVDLDSFNKKGGKPVLDLFNQLKINENKDKYNDPDELAIILAKLNQVKIASMVPLPTPLFRMDLSWDEFANTTSIVLSQTLPITQGLNKKKLREVLVKIFEGSEERDVDKMIDSVYDIENKLFGIGKSTKSIPINYQKRVSFKLSTVKSLNEDYPNINWKLYLEENYKSVGKTDVITEDSEVFNVTPDFIKKLNSVLGEVDGEALSYYFEMNIIYNYINYLPDDIQSLVIDLPKIDRVEYCYTLVNDFMDVAIAKYFVQNNFSPYKKQYAEKVVEYIKQSMMNRIPEMEWLDDKTIEYAYKKIAAMTEIIGYQDSILDTEKLYEKYKDFEVTDDDFFTNYVNYNRYKNREQLRKSAFSKNELLNMGSASSFKFDFNMEVSPQTINAQYITLKNKMNIPAGILQPPFFSSGIPDYINYGGIGSIIGHEFTHAFDNEGKNYDMNGNFSNWWTPNDIVDYMNLSVCFVKQYGEFYMEDKDGKKQNVNGRITLNENLADNGGLARAYESWKLSQLEDAETVKQENQQLPGLTQYTPDQLFFISFGHVWCENYYNSNSVIMSVIYDEHSPGFARVNGAVSNNKEFAKAFNCPLNSKMNPQNRCEIW